MKTLDIKGSLRKDTGKKSSTLLRKNGNIPCVMYGGKENLHFYASENSFRNLVYTHNVHIVNIEVDGKACKAIMKEIQFHPVTDKILHIDFIEAFDDKPVTVNMPIEITGNSVGIRNGGKLRQRRRSLLVKGLIKDLPDYLEIDISDLDIGDNFKVGDLTFDNLELLDPSRVMVVGVVTSRIAKGMEEGVVEVEAEEGAEAAEGEGEGEAKAEGEKAPAEEESKETAESKSE